MLGEGVKPEHSFIHWIAMIRIRVLGTRIDTDVHRNDLAKAPGSKLALAAQQVPPGDGTVTVNDWRNPSYDVLMVLRHTRSLPLRPVPTTQLIARDSGHARNCGRR